MSKARNKKGTPDHVDVHVGKRLKVRRSLLGLSQEKLADAVGLTFQQIQKYERGTNRISAGRLYQLSVPLGVPVEYFFEQLDAPGKQGATTGLSDNSQEPFGSNDLMQKKETLDLLRAYYSIDDPEARKDIYKFVKSMSERMSGKK